MRGFFSNQSTTAGTTPLSMDAILKMAASLPPDPLAKYQHDDAGRLILIVHDHEDENKLCQELQSDATPWSPVRDFLGTQIVFHVRPDRTKKGKIGLLLRKDGGKALETKP